METVVVTKKWHSLSLDLLLEMIIELMERAARPDVSVTHRLWSRTTTLATIFIAWVVFMHIYEHDHFIIRSDQTGLLLCFCSTCYRMVCMHKRAEEIQWFERHHQCRPSDLEFACLRRAQLI